MLNSLHNILNRPLCCIIMIPLLSHVNFAIFTKFSHAELVSPLN